MPDDEKESIIEQTYSSKKSPPSLPVQKQKKDIKEGNTSLL